MVVCTARLWPEISLFGVEGLLSRSGQRRLSRCRDGRISFPMRVSRSLSRLGSSLPPRARLRSRISIRRLANLTRANNPTRKMGKEVMARMPKPTQSPPTIPKQEEPTQNRPHSGIRQDPYVPNPRASTNAHETVGTIYRYQMAPAAHRCQ
jgi:hypothetical protein